MLKNLGFDNHQLQCPKSPTEKYPCCHSTLWHGLLPNISRPNSAARFKKKEVIREWGPGPIQYQNLNYSPAANKNLHLQSTDTTQCGVAPHSACPESHCKWMSRTGSCLQKHTEHVLVNGKKKQSCFSFGERWESKPDQNANLGGKGTAHSRCAKFPRKSSLCASISLSLWSVTCPWPFRACHWYIWERTQLYMGYMSYTWLWFCSPVYIAFWPLTTHSGQKDSKKGSTKKEKKIRWE